MAATVNVLTFFFSVLTLTRPVLHFVCDAMKVVYDIDIQEVVEKRAEPLCV